MEMYDPRTNTWTPFMRMGARRLQFGVAVMQNKLVVVGGRDGLKTLNTVCIQYFIILRRNAILIIIFFMFRWNALISLL